MNAERARDIAVGVATGAGMLFAWLAREPVEVDVPPAVYVPPHERKGAPVRPYARRRRRKVSIG